MGKTRITVADRLGSSETIDARREAKDGSYTIVIGDAEVVMVNDHALRLLAAMAREEAVARERDEMAHSRTVNMASERRQP